MLAGLEVRIREAEEEPGEGGARYEVGEKFHRVGSERGDVLKFCDGGRGRGLGGFRG